MTPAFRLPVRAEKCPCGHPSCTSGNVVPVTDKVGVMSMQDAQSLAHAANAYPKLVAVLKKYLRVYGPLPVRTAQCGLVYAEAQRLLSQLGEP